MNLEPIVAALRQTLARPARGRAALLGLSGIDDSGKGYVADDPISATDFTIRNEPRLPDGRKRLLCGERYQT